eukprot:scpid81297/ scgid25548/ 
MYNLNIPVVEKRKSMFLLASRTNQSGAELDVGFVILEIDISNGVQGLVVKTLIDIPSAGNETAMEYMPSVYMDSGCKTGDRLLFVTLMTNSNTSWIHIQQIPLTGKKAFQAQPLIDLPCAIFDGEFPSGSFQEHSRQLVFATLLLMTAEDYQSTAAYVAVNMDDLSISIQNQSTFLIPDTISTSCVEQNRDESSIVRTNCTYSGVAFKVQPNPLGPPCSTEHTLFWNTVDSDLRAVKSVEIPPQPYDDCVTYVTAHQYVTVDAAGRGQYTALLQTPLGNSPLTGLLYVNAVTGEMNWSNCSWRKMQTEPAPIGLVNLPEL